MGITAQGLAKIDGQAAKVAATVTQPIAQAAEPIVISKR